MTLEYILKAAIDSMINGHHAPHCYSAHVPGKGYTNDGSIPSDRADYLAQLKRTAESEAENMGYSHAYAEPGYTDPPAGRCILFANWNCFPRGLDTLLESAGYAIEWSDEWTVCDCGKAVRTSPDSYSYTPSYAIIGDCDLRCIECIADDPVDLLEHLSGNDRNCLSADLHSRIDLEAQGYRRLDETTYESGLHEGMNDDPKTIGPAVRKLGFDDYIFVQVEQSQFYTTFAVYVRDADTEGNDNE